MAPICVQKSTVDNDQDFFTMRVTFVLLPYWVYLMTHNSDKIFYFDKRIAATSCAVLYSNPLATLHRVTSSTSRLRFHKKVRQLSSVAKQVSLWNPTSSDVREIETHTFTFTPNLREIETHTFTFTPNLREIGTHTFTFTPNLREFGTHTFTFTLNLREIGTHTFTFTPNLREVETHTFTFTLNLF